MADLFNFEEEDNSAKQSPVTCLGKTFASDDERRAYFREELRKKLPDLKKIEGFPIGEDDDIINLSDPPYYTACPNPWINDFIDEWEKEKAVLQSEGKRKADFEVTEPYSSDVSEGKNNAIYMAHSYHTKVPHPAIMRYILHYTQPGDIVLDGFCGTGMTGVAANKCGNIEEVSSLREANVKVGIRHGICSDLSPIASLISASYNLSFDFGSFLDKAKRIIVQADNELGWMYSTKIEGLPAKVNYYIWSDVYVCPECGTELVLWDETVNLRENVIKDSFHCPKCGTLCTKRNMEKAWNTSYDKLLQNTVSVQKKVPVRVNYTLGSRRQEANVSQADFDVLHQIEQLPVENCSTTKVTYGDESSRLEGYGISHSHMFFTKRNFIYLSRIFELIGNDTLMKSWFTSVLQNASNMYKFRLDRKGGILSGTLFIPSLNIEQSPSKLLRDKLRDYSSLDYSERGNSIVSLSSATSLATIKENSVDYIFVDPPFGANIMYSELNILWEAWLKVQTNTEQEAIINKTQNKTLFDYQNLMNHSLSEFYRVLKPGKWLTMEFSNTSASVWNSIQNALQSVGFVVANVAALDKKQGTFKTVTTPTAVKQDLIITCYKPGDELIEKLSTSTDTATNVWDFIEDLLLHLPIHIQRASSTTAVIERSAKILYDRLIAYYVQHGYPVPMNAAEFQTGLKDHFVERDGMFFTINQVIEYEDKKSQTADFQPMSLFIGSESDGINWLKNKLAEGEKTYAELQPDWMRDMVDPKKGDQIPELMQILEENFLKDKQGYWRNPDPENAADLEEKRNKRLLSQFNKYVEYISRPNVRIKEASLEALRAGFKNCYGKKDFKTIVAVGNRIPETMLTEDDVLLQYYDIASMHV